MMKVQARQGRRGVRIWGREEWVSGCWDGDRRPPGGKMILCGCTTEVDRRVARGRCRHPPRQKSGGGRIRAERVNKSRVAYVKINN